MLEIVIVCVYRYMLIDILCVCIYMSRRSQVTLKWETANCT